MRNAPDFGFAIAHRVKALALAVGHADALGLAEVNVPGEFTHDQDVQPRDHFGAQGRRIGQLRINHRGTQVRKQAERLAKPEDCLLRAFRALDVVESRIAHRAKENRIRLARKRERALRQRMPGLFVGHAAHRRLAKVHRQLQRTQDLHRFRYDFLTDSVSREHRNLHDDLNDSIVQKKSAGTFRAPALHVCIR